MRLTIGTYNIHNGQDVGHDLSVIAADMMAQRPDIIAFQEVDRLATRSGYIDTPADLSKLTGSAYPYYYFAKAIDLAGNVDRYGQDGEYGVGVLSRYPIVEQECYKLDCRGREQRVLARTRIDVNGTGINFFTTHLSFEDAAIREGQLHQIVEIVASYDKCILTGDFNLRSLKELEVLYPLTPAGTTDHPIRTYAPDDWSIDCIDNICYSKEFSCENARSVVNAHSDHYMMLCELVLPLK